jgi:hypothetical protein
MLTGLSGRKSIPAASIRGEQTTGIGRVSPLAVRPGEGPLTVPKAGTHLGRRELVFMPPSRLSHLHRNRHLMPPFRSFTRYS